MPLASPDDTWFHVRSELRRILGRLAEHLAAERRRGRSATTDAVAGFAIEEGEAEGLVAELGAELSSAAGPPPEPPPVAASGSTADLPLARAAVAFELTSMEYDALLLAISVEVDSRFARLLAFLNDHVGRTRPTLGLVAALGGPHGPSPVDLAGRPLVRDGLVELEGDGPLSGASIKVARELLARLVGAPDPDPGPARLHDADPELLDRLVVAGEVRARLARWAAAVRDGRRVPVLAILGPPGVGRGTAGRAAAGAAGLPIVEVALTAEHVAAELQAARREARWHAAGLLVRVPDGLREADLAALSAGLSLFHAPVVLVGAAASQGALAAAGREPLIVALSAPDLEQRARLWRTLLPPDLLAAEHLGSLAARFQFTPHTMARAARRIAADRELLGHDEPGPTYADVERVCRDLGAAVMTSLAQRMPQPYRRDDLVLPARLVSELDLAIAWVRHRRQVLEGWGFSRRVAQGRGLTSLFSGAPGTGKTMAAQVLARDLDLDLYRVDLSRVMSKYIGETEKNLAQLFDEASASGAILFFDEADALFGKRSEVQDAHDRYANIEIGYLLQRMEEHEGVTILATNRVGDMDDAFIRRFHVILDFPMPDEAARLRIWEGMFPREALRDAGLQLGALARAFQISGGEIRNSVLAAAYLAAADGQPIGMAHLRRGLRRELAKTGRVLDERQRRALEGE